MNNKDIETINKAIQLHRENKLDDAEQIYRKLLASNDKNPDLLNLLGLLSMQKGRPGKAVSFIKKAIELKPKNPDYHSNIAKAYVADGKRNEAIQAYKKSLALKPDAETSNSLGALLLDSGNPAKAMEHLKNALKMDHSSAKAWYNMGNALSSERKLQEAVEAYEKAISINNDYYQAMNNLGNALKEMGQCEKALKCFSQTLRANPDFYEAYLNIGSVYDEMGCPEKAIENYELLERHAPNTPDVYINKGGAFRNAGEWEKSLKAFKKALEIDPDNAVGHFNLGATLLLHEKFAEGWKEYEWRLKMPALKHINIPFQKYDGTCAPDKTLLVLAEQGLGDSIQFSRYLSMARKRCGKVIFMCQPSLIPLLKNTQGIDEIIPEKTPPDKINFDFCSSIASLPGIFKTDLSNIPAQVPYIFPDKEKAKSWKAKIGNNSRLKVGICWAGSPTNTNDRNRSLDFKFIEKLLDIEGVDFYSLQKGPAAAQAANCNGKLNDLTEDLQDFSDTAALIENLDLVMSVDTAVAHLAGAMNKKVWLMIPFYPEWRWLKDRQDSPWYPSMQIFRQTSFADWESLTRRIATELKNTVNNNNKANC